MNIVLKFPNTLALEGIERDYVPLFTTMNGWIFTNFLPPWTNNQIYPKKQTNIERFYFVKSVKSFCKICVKLFFVNNKGISSYRKDNNKSVLSLQVLQLNEAGKTKIR